MINVQEFKISQLCFSAEDYITAIRQHGGNCKMVVCLVPNNKKDRYDAIKKHCCIDQPLPSQV